MTGLGKRHAFTLVELLVVIIIIAMLAGLLLPAIVRGRESARRAQCTNNQAQVAKAILAYESAKQHLPGYVDMFGTRGPFTWAVMILPDLGHNDLWKEARAGNPLDVHLPELVCPSHSELRKQKLALSYVVNCGRVDPDPAQLTNPQLLMQYRASAVFFNLAGDPRLRYNMRLEQITDGTSNTLLFSETKRTGLAWFPAPPPTEAETSLGLFFSNSQTVRPESFHGDGCVVTYGDGHQEFKNFEEIDDITYAKLLVPDDVKAGLTGNP